MLDTKTEWMKIPVRRDRCHEPLVEKLCKAQDGQPALFRYIKDLMIFSAMVGFSMNKREPLGKDCVSIILETYASDNKDSYIYLLALHDVEDVNSLKDDNLANSVGPFEEYCNFGLGQIKLWLDENPGDIDGVETLLGKIYEKAVENQSSKITSVSPESISPVF